MSYDIVRRIRIVDGRVLITAASNNVFPRHFEEWEPKSLTALLAKDGLSALELAIMHQYESGNYQSYTGKYRAALERLREFPEYQEFAWYQRDYDKASKARNERRAEFDALLRRALDSKDDPAARRIATAKGYAVPLFVRRVGSRHIFLTGDRSKAKIFRNEREARERLGDNYDIIAA